MAASSDIRIKLRDEISSGLRNIQRELVGFKRDVDRLSSGLGNLAAIGQGAMAVDMLWNIGKASIDAQIQVQRLETAFAAIYDSSTRGGAQLEYLREMSARLGLEFYSTAEAAKTFFASGQGTALTGELNSIYEGFSKAGAALALSGDQMQSVFVALGQMMSKGKVQAEELRGQLGEALPGAFTIAAKAMGVTTAELDKMMEDGKLLAEDLLPKMSEALEQKYAAAAENAANSLQGSINRMSSAWTEFKTNILDSEPVVASLQKITGALEHINAAKKYSARREEAIEELRAAGVEREGAPTKSSIVIFNKKIYEAEGGRDSDGYSEEQIRTQMAVSELARLQAALAEEQAQAQVIAAEKSLSKFSSLTRDVLKTTDDYKLREFDRKISELDAGWKDFQADRPGENLAQQEADYRAVREKLLEDKREFQKKLAESDKKAAGAARSAAVAQADYSGELERTRQQVSSLQDQLALDPSDRLAAQKIAIEEKYQKTLSKTREELEKQVARGKLTQAEAETLKLEKDKAAELQRQVDLRKAEQKAAERAVQTAGEQLRFYGELSEMSGSYSHELELQDVLLEAQAQKYRELDIPEDLVQQWKNLRRLQESSDPFAGAYRGLARWRNEVEDAGKQWEDFSYSMAASFESATRSMFNEFLATGRVTLRNFGLSFSSLLKDLAYQALVQPIVVSVVSGVQSSVYGLATGGSGRAGGSGGLGTLANVPVLSLLPDSLTSGVGGLFGGIAGGINSFGASLAPSLFAPSSGLAQAGAMYNSMIAPALGGGTVAQTTLMATLGAAGAGFGLGSLGGGLLAGLVGLNSGGGSLGGGIGAALGAGIGSIVPGLGTVLGGVLGGALGSVVGGLFGGGRKKDPPELYAGYSLDLLGGTTGAWADPADGLSHQVADDYEAYLESVAQQALSLSGGVRDSLTGINSQLSASYDNALSALGKINNRVMWEGEYITEGNLEDFGEGLTARAQEQIYKALAGIDLSPLAIAADGAVADSSDELQAAISGAISFLGLGASLGDYQDDFEAAVGDSLLATLNTLDTSALALDIDKASLEGWQTAAQALAAWDSINAAITEVIEPTAALDQQLAAANVQFDTWIAQLRELGWQESAIAEVEARRADYLNAYADAARRATEQDLSLRMLALQHGSDSWEYTSASLGFQQENELKELATQFGTGSDIYKQTQAIQQAEAAQARLQYLQGLLEEARQRELEELENAASEAGRLADTFANLADTLGETRKNLWTDDSMNPVGTSFEDLRGQFDDTWKKAMEGDEDALAALPGLSQELLEQGKSELANQEEYAELFYAVDGKLRDAQDIAEQQEKNQQAIHDSMQVQIESLQQSLITQQQSLATQMGMQITQQGIQLTTSQILAEMGNLKAAVSNALATASAYDGGGRLNSSSGIYGSHYATENELLQAKLDSVSNADKRAEGVFSAGDLRDYINKNGMTVQQWYDMHGRHEGFAKGGITPRHTPFWVGEEGPELLVAPQSFGVINHRASMALAAGHNTDTSAPLAALVQSGHGSIIAQLRTIAGFVRRSADILDRWDVSGIRTR